MKLLLMVFAGILALSLSACRREAAAKPADVDYYTCTMHPSVRSQDPNGKCPICSMDLVPVKKKGAAQTTAPSRLAGTNPAAGPTSLNGAGSTKESKEDGTPDEAPSEFTVPVKRLQQIGVTYDEIQKRAFSDTLHALGLVAYDQQRHWDYVARVDGYVQQLFVSSPGDVVEKDAPLLTLYSPDLLTTEHEFLDLLNTLEEARAKGLSSILKSTERLLESARQRLRQWNLSDQAIAQLAKSRQPQEFVTFTSPFRGVVQDLGVAQGGKVAAGDHLVGLDDLSAVWVWAQFYPDDLAVLSKGAAASISSESYPGESFPGTISVIDPFINSALRTSPVRFDVANPNLKLRPQMYVEVALTVESGEGVAVPVPAVLPTGRRNVVFIDRGEGKLEPRFIELGRKHGEFYEVKSGLNVGERIVTSGNFLIDAEAKVQGALKSW